MARKIKAAAKPATDYKALFASFRAANMISDDGDVGYAIESAELNASETDGVEDFSPEYWSVAYSSIAFTSAFSENASVREWFEARGYRW